VALTCQVKHVSAALEEELEALDTDNARFEQHLNAVTAGMHNLEEMFVLLEDAAASRNTAVTLQAADCEQHRGREEQLRDKLASLEEEVTRLTREKQELREAARLLEEEAAGLRASHGEIEGALATLNAESLKFFNAEQGRWQLEADSLRNEIDRLHEQTQHMAEEHERALDAEFVRGGAERLVVQLVGDNKMAEAVDDLWKQVRAVDSVLLSALQRSAERDEEEEATKRSVESLKAHIEQVPQKSPNKSPIALQKRPTDMLGHVRVDGRNLRRADPRFHVRFGARARRRAARLPPAAGAASARARVRDGGGAGRGVRRGGGAA